MEWKLMQVYQLKPVPERFMGAYTHALDISKQLAGDATLLLPIRERMMNNEPLLPVWGEGVSSTFKPASQTATEAPEISLWGGTGLLLNSRVYELLKDRLRPEGEFLPVTVDGEPMYVFNCLSFGREDESMCVKKYLEGHVDGLETLYFDEGDVSHRFLFKSKLQGGSALYCSSFFKALVKELGLEGLRFDTDLISPF